MSLLNKTISNNRSPYYVSTLIIILMSVPVVFYGFFFNITKTDIVLENFSPAVKLAALGDVACDSSEYKLSKVVSNNECRYDEVLGRLSKTGTKNVLLLGDLQYSIGDKVEFENNFMSAWQSSGLDGSNAYSVLGNHEYGKKNANDYFDVLRNSNIKTGESSQGYYAFTIGEWQFVALNSNCEYVEGCGTNSRQYMWLQDVLQSSTSKCVAALWHHPLFTSGKYALDSKSRDRMKDIWKLLEENNVDVVLNGHDHIYERFEGLNSLGEIDNSAPRQFIVGTGGRSLYEVSPKRVVGSEILIVEYGFLELNLAKNSYGWQYIDVNGIARDSGRKACND